MRSIDKGMSDGKPGNMMQVILMDQDSIDGEGEEENGTERVNFGPFPARDTSAYIERQVHITNVKLQSNLVFGCWAGAQDFVECPARHR